MASFLKTKLKVARDAIAKKDYKAAEEAASQVLEYEPANYNANVFLGLACLELGNHAKSEQAYLKAIESGSDQALAWQGLSKFYERTSRWQDFANALRRLADIFSKQDDCLKCAETLQKYIELQQSHGTQEQIISALGLLLPSSPLYPTLSELPEPEPTAPTSSSRTYAVQLAIQNYLPTLEEIVSLTEKREEEKIKKEVDRRRMRLGASRPEEIKSDVGQEVWGSSTLPSLYDEIINHPSTSDDLRRFTESKLLRRKHQHLQSLPLSGESAKVKKQLLAEVGSLSSGMVLLGLPDELAWMIFIETKDAYDLEDYDFNTLQRYFAVFPSLPLTRLVRGYFKYRGIPITLVDAEDDEPLDGKNVSDGNAEEDPFSVVLDAFADLPSSILAHRILSELYRIESDHENAIRVVESGLELLGRSEANYGKPLPGVRKAFKVVLAISLVHLFPPKHHARALRILDEVLREDPDNIPCLMGRGCVLQYSGRWSEAEGVFTRVDELASDLDVGLEAREERAWCKVTDGRLADGTRELRVVVQELDGKEGKEEQKARAWWRLGKSLWNSGDEGREEAYKHFITSLKRSSKFAPAFTSIGIYYAEVMTPPDLDRSSKCFQKAFELDAREGEAARRLAEGFAEEREWDLVEVVARRTIDGEGGLEGGNSGKEKVASGRYLPTNAWAWKAIGVVELIRRNYPSATQAFQVALRADQDDFLSWQRLGESYARSGRHAAAIKALTRALELRPDDWMCLYLIGDVHRLMGQFQRAVEVFEDVLRVHPEEICVSLALAETHLAHGRSQSLESFHTRAEASVVACLLAALDLFDKSPGFRRVAWKTAADVVYELSRRVSFNDTASVGSALTSLASLINATETDDTIKGIVDFPLVMECVRVDGFTAIQLAVAAYNYRISFENLDDLATASMWFDLGMALDRFSTQTKDESKSSKAAQQADQCVQKALAMDPGNDVYWSALGNLNFVENPKVSQHAYIKALEFDAKNALTWTNLGLLYLYYGDTELANEALFRAQTLDPDYVLAWVGQGLVATANGHHIESSALFEHAVGLSAAVPSADLEFAKRTFRQFIDSNLRQTPARELLLPPFHALDRYCRQQPNNATALHLFGLICERLDQRELATTLVSKSIAILERSYEENENAVTEQHFALANGSFGRLRLATGDYAGAVEAFNITLSLLSADDDEYRTKTLRAHAQFGSGLANFKLGELETALGVFESALEELPSEMVDVRGHVAVLLAQTLWALGGDEARQTARGQLLDCISSDPENLTAMAALVVMGILESDDSLVDAALSEIQSLTLDKRAELDPGGDVPQLLLRHNLSQGREEEALAEAQRAVHTQPLHYTSRRILASLLLQQGHAAAAAAVVTGEETAHGRDSLDNTLRVAAVAAATEIRTHSLALRLAQKSVVLAPWTADNWRALAYTRCVGADP